jgi:hypothetical protein
VDGAPICSRLGCDELAVAVFAFDARECLVWLDPLDAGGRGAGLLCGRHADRMSPPRDWILLDRRGAESRLWLGQEPTVTSATSSRRRERAPRPRSCAPVTARLPFDTPAPAPAPAPVPVARDPEPPVVRTPDVDRRPWSPHDRPGPDLEQVLDARTPLLARAFEAARPLDDGD